MNASADRVVDESCTWVAFIVYLGLEDARDGVRACQQSCEQREAARVTLTLPPWEGVLT